jgi:uncharacterized membrane protein
MRALLPYLAATTAFVLIDLVWLGVIAKGFYRRELGTLMANPINVPVAMFFYLIFPLGLVIFAIEPAHGNIWGALRQGALFGFFAYATYDLTNLATLKNWSAKLSLADMAWGTVLSGACAAIGAWASGS